MGNFIDRIGALKLRLNNEVGRRFFGNTIRFTSNVRGVIRERRAALRSNLDLNTEDEYAKTLRRNGFVDMGRIYDPSTIQAIEEKYDWMIEDDEHSEITDQMGRGYSRTLTDPLTSIPEILDLLTDDLITTLQSYYGSHFALAPAMINFRRNYHVPPEEVEQSEAYSNYWHCDDHSTDRIKLFIYFSDVTEEDGPFQLLTKPETKRVVRDRNLRADNRDEQGIPGGVVEEVGRVEKFTGPVGTAAFCNTQRCLHRAGVPAEGHQRDLLQLQFAASSSPFTNQLRTLRESVSNSE